MSASLSLVTFEDLVDKITEFRDRARAGESRDGWDKLLDVATSLSGGTRTEDDPSAVGPWHLTEVEISGYQGIGDHQPFSIAIDPTPGITVVHGPNGSGKSSIADAIETALQGRVREPALAGRGGNLPIWERDHCGRDAQQAVVELTLRLGSDSLIIRCCLDRSSNTTEWTARRRSGTSESVLDLSGTGWISAVTGYRPVVSYAVIERQVQLARNLQQFLEGLLAFGSCFGVLTQEVDRRSNAAITAKERWDTALRSAQEAVDQVDQDRARADQALLSTLAWPTVDEDPDNWLLNSELTETGTTLPEVIATDLDELRVAAARVEHELLQLHTAETSLHPQLAGPLKDLHAEAVALGRTGDHCPVCGTDGVPWLDRLTESVEGLVETQARRDSCREAITDLRTLVTDLLGNVLTILSANLRSNDQPGWWHTIVVPLLDAAEQAGERITNDLRSSASAIAAWLMSSECQEAVAAAVAESDYLRQWRHARRDAITEFISVWRSAAADASQAPSWISAGKRLTTLQNNLRIERANVLSAQTNLKVQALLADVGITLKSITVQGRQASLQIVDQQSRDLELSMLSAGQRNALLLAPMLAVSGGGPFGFLILDDPVHAFDQVRVDRLATAVADLAQSRRVVVLTHDERLKEHLLARQPDCDMRGVSRDATTGVVTSLVQGEMWQILLDDALGVLDAAATHPEGVTLAPHDIVRGLCRQAVDNSLRSLVLRTAVQQGRDPQDDLEVLDQEDRTRLRIRCARELIKADTGAVASLDNAERRVASYLDGWNRATHGNPPTDTPNMPSLRTEIQAAKQACEMLTAM